MGVLYCFLGAISFGLLACASKAAERRNCNASALVVSALGWGTLIMLARTAFLPSNSHLPLKGIAVAIIFGICGAVAYFAFQTSIRTGKITVAWLMMNLSGGVPAVVSIWMYREKLTTLKLVALGLALMSVFFLFRGQQIEDRRTARSQAQGA